MSPRSRTARNRRLLLPSIWDDQGTGPGCLGLGWSKWHEHADHRVIGHSLVAAPPATHMLAGNHAHEMPSRFGHRLGAWPTQFALYRTNMPMPVFSSTSCRKSDGVVERAPAARVSPSQRVGQCDGLSLQLVRREPDHRRQGVGGPVAYIKIGRGGHRSAVLHGCLRRNPNGGPDVAFGTLAPRELGRRAHASLRNGRRPAARLRRRVRLQRRRWQPTYRQLHRPGLVRRHLQS